jgi:hypothetical protein
MGDMRQREGKRPLEDVGINVRIILEWILRSKVGGSGLDLKAYLAQDRGHWRVLVNTVMNLQVPKKVENTLTS